MSYTDVLNNFIRSHEGMTLEKIKSWRPLFNYYGEPSEPKAIEVELKNGEKFVFQQDKKILCGK